MWIAIFTLAALFTVAGMIYLSSRVYGFAFLQKLISRKRLRLIFSALVVIEVFLILLVSLGIINAVISFLILVVFWLLSDLIFFIIAKIRKRKFKLRWSAIPALASAIIYLTVGWFAAHNVDVTSYEIYTDKQVGQLKILMFADAHIGSTFDGEGFARQVERMQQTNPDAVIIAGDYVDDDTAKKDMEEACAALGALKTTYGVYFAFGNHDKGYYDSRDFSGDDLIYELEKNNVTVLQDEAVLIDNRFYIVGRCDSSENVRGGGRKDIAELTAPLDKDLFTVVINHQPTDYENETAAGVDLVLSGHTHGGQMFPLTAVMGLISSNDRIYGYEKRENTQFIVTSGISDWALKFKTGTKSEFVVIDIKTE